MELSKIQAGTPDKLNVVIEIPYGSNIKYEIDKESGAVFVDRILYGSTVYPANYGFVPQTLAGDGDPADILVLCPMPLQAGSVIKCRLVGVLLTGTASSFSSGPLSSSMSKTTPLFDSIQSYEDLPKAQLDLIRNFFEVYKMLEPGKWVKVKGYADTKTAIEILNKSLAAYKG